MKKLSKIFFFVIMLIIILFLTNCEEIQVEPLAKISNFKLYQNYDSASNKIYKYDSIFLKILPLIYYEDWANNDYFYIPGRQNTMILDYYKSIKIFTIYDFSNIYKPYDDISNIFLLTYYDRNLLDMFPGEQYIFIDNLPCNTEISDFLISSPAVYPLKLQLNTPPNSTVLFQIRAEIELLDGRHFTLYSDPVYIKP